MFAKFNLLDIKCVLLSPFKTSSKLYKPFGPITCGTVAIVEVEVAGLDFVEVVGVDIVVNVVVIILIVLISY